MIAGAVTIRHTVHIQIYCNVIQTILKTIGKSGVKVFGCAKSKLGEAIIFADEIMHFESVHFESGFIRETAGHVADKDNNRERCELNQKLFLLRIF
jgi:hypothetical protein